VSQGGYQDDVGEGSAENVDVGAGAGCAFGELGAEDAGVEVRELEACDHVGDCGGLDLELESDGSGGEGGW